MNKQIRILHFIETKGPGGAETVYIQVIKGMAERGYKPFPCVTGPGWVESTLKELGFYPTIISTNRSFDFKFLSSLIQFIKNKRINLIHSHLLGANLYASLAGIITRKPVVSTFHGIVDIGRNQGTLNFLKGKIISFGSSKIVCVSKFLQKKLTSEGWAQKDKMEVIYNGVDLEKFSRNRKNINKCSLGFKETDILIGIIGNIRPTKGHKYFIESAALVRKKFPNVKYLIVGHASGEDQRKFFTMIESFSLKTTVYFWGFQKDVTNILANLNVFVVPSTSEGFSIATIEAMAMEVPVVATRCGGPEEIITNGKNGLLVTPADSKALANAIIRILSTPELASKFIQEGKKTAQRFSLDAMLSKYDSLYKKVLGLSCNQSN